jgi:hypothetical protein
MKMYLNQLLREQLLIQQAALCWLKLNLVELSYSGKMNHSITLTLGMYLEKRLSAKMTHRGGAACKVLKSEGARAPSISCCWLGCSQLSEYLIQQIN